MRVPLMHDRRAYLCDPAEARTSELVICIYDDDNRTVTSLHYALRPEPGDRFEYQGVTWELERWVEKPEGKAWVARPTTAQKVQ